MDLIQLNQVQREENVEADALTNLGPSLRIPLETKIPIINVMIPTIEDPNNRSDSQHRNNQGS